MREASPYMGLGMQLALSMVFFVGGGYLLDRWLDTSPWLLVAGAVLGMVAVFVNLFRLVAELNKKHKASSRENASDEVANPHDA